MTTFLVRYWERDFDAQGGETRTLLGSETLDGIAETLLPGLSSEFKVFCTKKFLCSEVDHWFVHAVEESAASPGTPLSYEVVLEKPYATSPVEYLNESLAKTGASLEKTVRAGTLVEVDYGFMPAVGRSVGGSNGNEGYCDTIQKGEMHKRRLCIVVKARKKRLQVVPVTSKPQDAADKTAFEIEPTSLAAFVRYGASGNPSYAICSMVETVSVNRVLPPESKYQAGGRSRQGRNTRYVHAVSSGDLSRVRDGLLHVIGVTDYAQVRAALGEAHRRCSALEGALAYNAELEVRVAELIAYRRLAEKWAGELGLNVEDALRDV